MTDGRKVRSIRAQAERNTKHTKNFLIFATAVIFIFFAALVFENFFNITSITVTGLIEGDELSAEQVAESSGISPGDNLILVSAGEAEKRLLKEYPYLDRAEIKKHFPTRLEIILEFSEAAMALEVGEDLFLVSAEGRVLESIERDGAVLNDTVCRVKVPALQRVAVGDRLVFRDSDALEVLTQVYGAFLDNGIAHRLTSLDTRDKFSVKGVMDASFEINFGTWEDADGKAFLLAEVLKDGVWTGQTGTVDVSDSREAVVRLTGGTNN